MQSALQGTTLQRLKFATSENTGTAELRTVITNRTTHQIEDRTRTR